MSELIKREDAINATWQEPSYTDPINVLTEVRDRINEIPTAPRWVRCEDELPKYTGRYIVWCGVNWYGEGMHGDFMTANYNTVSGRWSVDCDKAINGPLIGDILYWMPIEPPTETERSET